MISVWNCVIFAIMLLLYVCEGRISDKRLCGDPTCSEPVSSGKTLIRYISDDPRVLTFDKNVDCTIYSKSAGSKPDLWGAEIKGKRGYVPKGFVREHNIFKSDLLHILDTESSENQNSSTENVTNDSPAATSIKGEKQGVSDVETTLEDVEHSGIEPCPASEILYKTPSLADLSHFNLPFADISLPSFPGSGVSAESVENETPSNFDGVSQPYEVVDGTTLFYDTDGGQSELKTSSQVQPTQTTASLEPSASPEQPAKHETHPTTIPPVVTDEPPDISKENVIVEGTVKSVDEDEADVEGSAGRIYQLISNLMSEESGSAEEETKDETIEKSNSGSDDKILNGNDVGSKKAAEGKETEYSDFEKKTEPIFDHKEESESVKHSMETTPISPSKMESESVPESKGETYSVTEPDQRKKVIFEKMSESVKDTENQDIIGEPLTEQTENEDDIEEEDDDFEDDDEEEEDDELDDEESEEVTVSPDSIIKKEIIPEQLQSVDTIGTTKESADKEELENGTSSVPSTNVDMPLKMSDDMEGSSKEVLHEFEMPENVTEEKNTLEETETSRSFISDHTILEPVLENQAEKVNDTSVESAEETTDSREVIIQSEESDSSKQEDAIEINSDSLNVIHSVQSDEANKEILNEKDETIQGSDFPEDIYEKVKSLNSEHDTKHAFNLDNMSSQSQEESTTETSSDEQSHGSVHDHSEIVTEPSDGNYYEVPPYESSTEETSTFMPDDVTQHIVSGEVTSEDTSEPSGGIFSGITDSLSAGLGSITSIFSSSPDANVAEEAEEMNESTTEKIQETQEEKEMSRKRDVRDAAWSSLWGSPTNEHVTMGSRNQHLDEEMDIKSSACKVNYDPSAGIDSHCSDVSGDLPNIRHQSEAHPIEPENSVTVKSPEDDDVIMDLQRSSYDTFVYLVITAVTVLLFSLGHYYIEKKRRDGSLVAKINELEKELLVSSKECLILKDDLQATKEKLLSIENSSVDSSEAVMLLNAQLEESKNARTELEEQVASLEKELEGATEAGLELNRMLSEFLTAQHGSDTVMKSVEQLQKQLDSQQSTIATMTASLNAKNTENEALEVDLTAAKEKISSLEEGMKNVNENLNDVLSQKLEMEEELLEKNKSLQTSLEQVQESKNLEIEQLRKEINSLQEKFNEQNDNLVTKESEVAVLQDCLKQLRNADEEGGEDKLQALLDVGHTKAELKLMAIERDALAEKLQGEEDARRLLEDHVNVITEQVNKLRESYEKAEKEKIDAQTRLGVLSDYFKDKETQLQKELGLHEAMCLQKEGDATSTYERIKSLQEEIENYKSQNEMLKKEILDQERGLKCQIATLEKKAHENWVAARQAERKLEESKQEAGQLRNRLTIVEKNVTNVSKNGLTGDSNGELPTSPVHMGISNLQDSSSSPLHYQHHEGIPASPPLPGMIPGQPLPPNPFMGIPPPGVFIPPPPPGAPFMPPPPPPPLFPGDRRPPPLGRMSSPPPHHYSPPPPDHRGTYSPYDHSPPPSPPPGHLYRSPPPHDDDSPDKFRQHRSPPPPHFNPYSSPASRPPPHWDDPHGNPRSGFRPLPPPIHRDSPREPKGSALSSGHSSESLEKSSRHSGRV
ncbi:transport and Golgi organization protein 1-like isoform X2 [Periplaneta americana]|uniref:transport and Golgi organization protein 1-like isoform X2 n=1 Tax=Periplaneta americana TaxID=6978 RepID=UPI0037E7C3A2